MKDPYTAVELVAIGLPHMPNSA